MITLNAVLIQSLFYIEPYYSVAEGTDIELKIEKHETWEETPMFAIIDNETRLEIIDNSCIIPCELVNNPRFTITLEAGNRIVSNELEILVSETLRGANND